MSIAMLPTTNGLCRRTGQRQRAIAGTTAGTSGTTRKIVINNCAATARIEERAQRHVFLVERCGFTSSAQHSGNGRRVGSPACWR
jgi:hypothetical protein